jgi:hypothetical protein
MGEVRGLVGNGWPPSAGAKTGSTKSGQSWRQIVQGSSLSSSVGRLVCHPSKATRCHPRWHLSVPSIHGASVRQSPGSPVPPIRGRSLSTFRRFSAPTLRQSSAIIPRQTIANSSTLSRVTLRRLRVPSPGSPVPSFRGRPLPLPRAPRMFDILRAHLTPAHFPYTRGGTDIGPITLVKSESGAAPLRVEHLARGTKIGATVKRST